MLKTPANLLAGNERTAGRGGERWKTDRQARMERERERERRDGKGENEEQKEEEGAHAWTGGKEGGREEGEVEREMAR